MSGSSGKDALTGMALPAGTVLGKYEIVRQLGAGGESIVYKGRDTTLDRFVAIKQVPPQMAADEKFSARFREVARQLAKLNCEQIVTIYELFEQNGGLFVVMEFVEGHSIETTLAAMPGAIDPKAVLQIVWRIAAGLAMLHRAGLVHRDLKPGNIIVGEGLRVKITDFGMAARIGVPASMRLGTTKYMAPEMFAGEPPDARADIYSLGMIAYEMLLGRQKFNEVFHDVVRDQHSEALRWMKWHSSPDQAVPALHEIDPNVPAALSGIVVRMMDKDPSQRYPGVELLGRDIRGSFSPRATSQLVRKASDAGKVGSLVGAPVTGDEGDDLTVVPAAVSEPLTAAIPKRRMSLSAKLILAGAALVVVLGGLTGYITWEKSRRNDITKKAALSFDQAMAWYKRGGQAERSADKKEDFEKALDAFRKVVAKYDKTRFARRAEAMGYMSRLYLDVLAKDWKKADEDQQIVQQWIQNAQRRSDDFSRDVERELGDFRDYWSRSKIYATLMANAKEAEDQGDFDTDEQLLQDARKYAGAQAEWLAAIDNATRRMKEKQKQTVFWGLFRQAEDLQKKKNLEQARSTFLKAIEVLDRDKGTLPEKMHVELKQAAQGQVDALDRQRQYDSDKADGDEAVAAGSRLLAAAAYERALAVRPEDPDKLRDKIVQLKHDHYLAEGRKQLQAGDLRAAQEAFLEARKVKDNQEIETELNKIRDQGDYKSLLEQAWQLFGQDSYEAALAKYEQAAKMSVPAPDPNLPDRITECRYRAQMAQAAAYRANKEWDKAIEAMEQARKIKPTSATVDVELKLIKRDRSYEQKMDQARAAFKGRDYAGALARAQEAQGILAADEVKTLIEDIHYQQQMEMGDSALAARDYAGAQAYYELAKRYKSTPEVEEKIKKCKDAIKSKWK